MCGRTSLFIPQDELEGRFDARVVIDGGYQPRFNIAPGGPLAVITNETSDEINQYTWGLVPQWADDPSNGLINARSETADENTFIPRRMGQAPLSRPLLGLLRVAAVERRTKATVPYLQRRRRRVRDGRALGGTG